MAKKKVKRYYWLKLKEDFFDEDTIEWLEEQDGERGKEYCLFYLKLCVKSLKSNGLLMRQVGNILIPYDIDKIANITKTDVNIAEVALDLLKKIGYIQVLDSGGLFLTQIENMTGSETESAERMRRSRAKNEDSVTMLHQSDTDVTSMSQQSHIEKEYRERDKSLEIDLEKEIEKDIDFNYFWSIYPRQIGMDETYIEWLHLINQLKVNKLDFIQATRNYYDTVKDYAQKFIKYPKNFILDKTYIDFMPENYRTRHNVIPISKPIKNKFNDFPQRNYTKDEINEMERKLINRQ